MINCGNIGIDCEYCENKNKCLIQDIYNQLKDHPYFNNPNIQENWDSARNLFRQLERLIAELKPWNNRVGYFREIGYLYKDKYSLFFSEYCHDTRMWLGYSKVFDTDTKRNYIRWQWLKEYLEIVEAYLDDKDPIIHSKTAWDSDFIKTSVYYKVTRPTYEGFYTKLVYDKKDKENLLNVFKKYADKCQSKPLQEWGEYTYNAVLNNESYIYGFIDL